MLLKIFRLFVLIAGTPAPTGPTEPPITSGTERTVVLIRKETQDGQDLFIRGGIDATQRPGENFKHNILFTYRMSLQNLMDFVNLHYCYLVILK